MPHKDPIAAAAYKQAYYLAHREKAIASAKQRRLRMQDKHSAERSAVALLPTVPVPKACIGCGVDITGTYLRKHGMRCKACVALYQKAYRKKNAVHIADTKKEWKGRNKEHVARKDQAYAAKHPERRVLARTRWETANPGVSAAAKAKNRIARAKRVPSWLSDDDRWMIEQAYELAAVRTQCFGFVWHVDHIIPLNGKKVSGLHVPLNIQVIPWRDNLRKGARYGQ